MSEKELKEKIMLKMIQSFGEFVSKKETRLFGADLSDVTKKYTEELFNLCKQYARSCVPEEKTEPKTKLKPYPSGLLNDNLGKQFHVIGFNQAIKEMKDNIEKG